jgi:hypothetical protein
MRRLALAGLVCLPGLPGSLVAQDIFEIQVYEYLTVPRGKWNLETHFNHSIRGVKEAGGTVQPTQGQSRLTFELTRGLTDWFELAGYLAFARQPGEGPRFAAWRIRPRVRAPEGWHLPLLLSLSAEVAFPENRYEAETATLEIRPVLERRFGPLQLDLNPVVGRSLKGPGAAEGWDFEPGARVGVAVHRRVDLSLEYYGSYGPLGDFLPRSEQVHLFFGGGDVQLRENLVLNLGLGLAATSAGEQTVLKTRLGWMF